MRYSTASEPASHSGGENWSVELFELSAERALWILEQDHLVTRVGVADEDSAFGGMPGGRDHWISRCHFATPFRMRQVARRRSIPVIGSQGRRPQDVSSLVVAV